MFILLYLYILYIIYIYVNLYVYNHIFFIHLSVNGHLDCFYVLAIVNTAALNIEVYVSFWIIVLSGCMPRVELLNHMTVLFLNFWGTSMLFSIVTCTNLCSHQQCRRVPFFSTLSPAFVTYKFFKLWPFWLVWGDTSL